MNARPFLFSLIRLAVCALLVMILGLPAAPGMAAQTQGDIILTALETTTMQANPTVAHRGEDIVYTVTLKNSTTTNITGVSLTSTLPTTLAFVQGTLNTVPNTVQATYLNGVISWSGTLNGNAQVKITYSAKVSQAAPLNQNIINTAAITGGGESFSRAAQVLIEPYTLYCPTLGKGCSSQFADNFSNSNSGWPINDNGIGLSEYNGGEYRILVRVNPETTEVLYARPGVKATDYTVLVDVRNPNAVMNGSYGLAFGASPDWSTMYTFEIYPDGWYAVYRWDGEYDNVLAEGFSPAIMQGSATNQIQVDRLGATINAYANGQLLVSLSDDTYSGSRYVGLTVYSYDDFEIENDPDVDIRFDNFVLNPTNCFATAGLAAAPDNGPSSANSTVKEIKRLDKHHLRPLP